MKKYNYDDGAFLGGDEWEYQSMGVNYTTGHGFPICGNIEPFEKYKLTKSKRWNNGPMTEQDWYNYYYNQYTKEEPKGYRFYRTPGYPFFIGVVYDVFGIYPKKVKQIQLLMLVFIAAFLPFVGFYYWKVPGALTAIPAGFLFLNQYSNITVELMTESLIMFTIFVLVLAFLWHQKKQSILSAVVFGLLLGINVLIKGSLIYVPPLFCLYFFYQAFKKKEKWLTAILIAVVGVCTILPWSMYATKKAGEKILLSTQGDRVMLHGNNELAYMSWEELPEQQKQRYGNNPNAYIPGSWNPVPDGDTAFFYNTAAIKDLPQKEKFSMFMKTHLDKIPDMVYYKLIAGFENFNYIKLGILLMIFEMMYLLTDTLYGNILAKRKQFRWYSLGVTILLAVIAFKIIPLLVILFALYAVSFFKDTLKDTSVTVPVFIMLLNFLILTASVFGYDRFTYVMDFLFIQTALFYCWHSLQMVYSWVKA